MSALTARLGTVVLSAALVVAGLELTSYAATGGVLTLGSSNSASRTTSLTTSGRGPALSLHAKGAPLAVSNGRKIVHLNADTVDGQHAQALKTHAITYVIPSGTAVPFTFSLSHLPPGSYLASISVYLTSTSTTPAACFLRPLSQPTEVFGFAPLTGSSFSVANGTGLVTVEAGATIEVGCIVADSVSTLSAQSRVVLTPLAGVSTRSLVGAFRAADR